MDDSQCKIIQPDITEIVAAVAEGLDLIRQHLESLKDFDISTIYDAVAEQIYKIDHSPSYSNADKEKIRFMLAHLGSPARDDIY